MKANISFSVVVPAYNRADLIGETLDSILLQTYPHFEIIVVDNNSTDATVDVVKSYVAKDSRVRLIQHDKNYERSRSRNTGMSNATGDFLTFLDSDDIMYPNCLKDAHEFALSTPQKFFHNLYEVVDFTGKPSRKIVFPPIINQYKQICQGNFLSCIGVFLEREIYSIYRFTEDPLMIGSEDYEIWFRVLAGYELGRIHKVNCAAREHPGRSVHSNIYKNLEYQRQQIIKMIMSDSSLMSKYSKYLGYINSINFYHQAMYSLYNNQKFQAVSYMLKSIEQDKGILLKKRFLAFSRNLLFSYIKPTSKKKV